MTEVLGNIYDRFIAIVFGSYFFLLRDCENLFFDKMFFQNLLIFLSKKTAELTLLKRNSTYQELSFECVDGKLCPHVCLGLVPRN